jgi:hypothetical protein
VLTLFTTGKSFKAHIGVIQRNAIQSWTRLHPEIEIILFGTDEGAAEVAREFGLRHEPHVACSQFGTKRLDYMFAKAQQIARYDVLCYINCDILLLDDFCSALRTVTAAHKEFLMVGQRIDADITQPWSFDRPVWQAELRDFAARHGKRRPPNWIDYFAFTRGLYGTDLPPFVVGVFWDNWLVWKALTSRKPVVDVSPAVLAIHQNHDYNHHPQGEAGVWKGLEAARNAQLAGGWAHLRTIAHASEILDAKGLRPNGLRHWAEAKRRCESVARFLYYDAWQPVLFTVLNWTRPLRTALGMRTEPLRPPTDKV